MSGRSLRGRVGPALAAAAMVFASAQAAPPATTVEGHLLAGHVTLDGKALPGASVVLTSGGGGTFVRTDDSGAYAFRDLLDGDYTISVRLPGYGFTPPRRTLHLQDFDASSLDFDAVYIGAPPGSGIVVAPPPSTMPPAVAPAAPSAAAASVPAVPSAPPPAAAPPVQTPAPAYPSAPAPSITAAAPAAEALPAASAPAAAASASAPAPATPAASAAVSAPVAPIATPPPAPTAAAAEVTGHAYAKHGTGMGGVTVGYNMTRRPAVDARLPAVITGEDGSFTLPALPPHPAYEPQPWIEAHGPLFQYCPPQVFLPAPNPVEFRACDPPEPSKAPHQLSGSVTRLGKPLPRVEIHQAFSSRRGYTYEEGPLGPVVAYSDENGHWQFTAPSVSARNEVSGYFSYLVAVLPDGPRFCPGQLFLPEGAGNLDHLDFAACGAEGSLAVGSSRIAAAPASGSIQDVALALVHGDIAVAWVQDVGAISTVWFARWNGKSWSAPVAAANGHVADDPNHRLSLAAAGDHLALAYLDRDDALGTHVAVSLSDDGGHGWHGEPVATFVAHSSSPSIAVDVEGGVQLAYYFEGDQVPVRRVIYQRRLPGREFHGVALPLTNTLNKETGWWAQPPVAISIDENAVASVAYFLAGPDHYLQAAYWKPGMPTAIRIAETAQPTQSPEIQIAAGGARANAIFRMAGEDGAAATWLAGGANGGEWAAPLRLPSNAAEGTVAVDVNASGDYAYAISGAPSFVLLRERAGIPVPLPLAAPDAHATQRISLALDDERRLTLAYVDAQDGSLMIYRAALPWD